MNDPLGGVEENIVELVISFATGGSSRQELMFDSHSETEGEEK